jgi:hypothetical protein
MRGDERLQDDARLTTLGSTCEIAGVAPTYQELNGHDAAAFIVSANLARHNLSKGPQAMALAMIYPQPHSLPRKV